MTKFIWLAPALFACACAAPAQGPEMNRNEALSQAVAGQSTAELWLRQSTASDPLELLMVEAELGARGEVASDSKFIGSRTASSVGVARYGRSSTTAGGGLDCGDFPSPGAAQRYFLAAGGPLHDPHNLDGDGDGFACEWGVSTKTSRDRYRPRAQPSVSVSYRYSSAVCHVGPRGGTYTITASGNKDYDGC